MAVKNDVIDESGSAIICSHVAKQRFAILLAVREEPLEADDSGWQFLCNTVENEDAAGAQIWSISEVLAYDPSISKFINERVGTRLRRQNKDSQWRVEKEVR